MRKKPAFTYYSQRGRGYSEEYQAVLDAGIGTAPSASVKTKDNTCINSLKEAGIWDLLDFFFMLSTDDSDFATIDWKNPGSRQATKVASPTFTANQGFAGNGTSSYLNLNFVPSTHGVNYTLNESGYGLYIRARTTALTDRVEMGARSGASSAASFYQALTLSANTGSYGSNISATNTTYTEAVRTGNVHVKRTAAAAEAFFKDGISVSTSTKAAAAVPIYSFFLGALNQANTAVGFSNAQIAMAWGGASLHGKESDFNTIISTRLT